MIRLDFPNIEELKSLHFEAVKSYVKEIMRTGERNTFYLKVLSLPGFESFPRVYNEKNGFEWLRKFILADIPTLAEWVASYSKLLKFDYMKKVYLNRFSNGCTNFVDKGKMYNSYTLFDKMNVRVCPYCEHEFIEVVTVMGGKQTKRTMEFDHFYPKGDEEYPALAMCFFNLVPSCKSCNQLKMTNPVAANPYDMEIENWTNIYPDIPLGVNMGVLTEQDCNVKFHAVKGMVVNEDSLALEQRYESQSSYVYQLLKNKQNFSDDKLAEMERMGFGTIDGLRRAVFGKPRNEAKGVELHTKMKEDLIGY